MAARHAMTLLSVWMWMSGAPPLAFAQGTVTSFTRDPIPAIACQLNTAPALAASKVRPTASPSNSVTPPPTVHLPGNFPIEVFHAYASAGTTTLRAQGATNCKGNVVAHLQVLGPVITGSSRSPRSRRTAASSCSARISAICQARS
jgi:hypothetical protein